jgi:hypothetical protein
MRQVPGAQGQLPRAKLAASLHHWHLGRQGQFERRLAGLFLHDFKHPEALPMGANGHPSKNGLTHGFIVHFANADDRNYYVEQDPAHQAFKKEIEPLVAKTTVLDFTNGKF